MFNFFKKTIKVLKLKHKRSELEYELLKLYKNNFNSSKILKLQTELGKVNHILLDLTDDCE